MEDLAPSNFMTLPVYKYKLMYFKELFDAIYYVIWHLELLGGFQWKKTSLYKLSWKKSTPFQELKLPKCYQSVIKYSQNDVLLIFVVLLM